MAPGTGKVLVTDGSYCGLLTSAIFALGPIDDGVLLALPVSTSLPFGR